LFCSSYFQLISSSFQLFSSPDQQFSSGLSVASLPSFREILLPWKFRRVRSLACLSSPARLVTGPSGHRHVRSPTCSITDVFNHQRVQSLACSITGLFDHRLVRSPARSITSSFDHRLVQSPAHSITGLFNHRLVQSPARSITGVFCHWRFLSSAYSVVVVFCCREIDCLSPSLSLDVSCIVLFLPRYRISASSSCSDFLRQTPSFIFAISIVWCCLRRHSFEHCKN